MVVQVNILTVKLNWQSLCDLSFQPSSSRMAGVRQVVKSHQHPKIFAARIFIVGFLYFSVLSGLGVILVQVFIPVCFPGTQLKFESWTLASPRLSLVSAVIVNAVIPRFCYDGHICIFIYSQNVLANKHFITRKLLQQAKNKRGQGKPKKSWGCQVSTKISDLLVIAKFIFTELQRKCMKFILLFVFFFHAKSWTGKEE